MVRFIFILKLLYAVLTEHPKPCSVGLADAFGLDRLADRHESDRVGGASYTSRSAGNPLPDSNHVLGNGPARHRFGSKNAKSAKSLARCASDRATPRLRGF